MVLAEEDHDVMITGNLKMNIGRIFILTHERHIKVACAQFVYDAWRRCAHDQVKEEDQTLTHGMFVSYLPNWLGQTQPRVVRQEGDLLHLSTASPIQSGGKTVMSYLTWTRAGNVCIR
ncbi:Lipocalin-like domain-containing protein [Sphingobium sp. AP50]|uniref:lipocalin-like domain-containing protein n=1 Tax=Sphingobium sp. AP50 TaxID=1884369 RepID=UPI0008CE9322|nr:lipocalin-like domain-containing protein [Sphingobium sp. AP50]SEJ47066.1 Lipocalin-like domain-containing protein [Sphingobium sp. AP50]